MKRFFLLVTFVCAAMLTACEYDDSALVDRMDGFESRLQRLEELCAQMNTNISSLQTIVNALQQKDYITTVAPISKDGKEIGYSITFSSGKSITIYHGEDGKDGQNGTDGHSPQVGVKQDTDGVYYWTVEGEWLTDAAGAKIQAAAEDGEDGKDGTNGVTPQLKIEDDYWYVSYDEGKSWTKLGKASGEDGADGSDGTSGDNIFQSVRQDANNVYFILSDGTTITIPKSATAENIALTYIPRYSDGKATVLYSEKADSYVELDFEVSPASAAANWRNIATVKAVYTETRAGVEFVDMPILEWSTDAAKGTITVKASGANLSDAFFAGSQEASARLVINGNGVNIISDYVPLVAKKQAFPTFPQQQQPSFAVELPVTASQIEYSYLTADYKTISSHDFNYLNNVVYGRLGLSAPEFWERFNHTYYVTVQTEEQKIIGEFQASISNEEKMFECGGVRIQTLLSNENSFPYVIIGVNNAVLAGNSYKVVIRIHSNNIYVYGNFELICHFTIKADDEQMPWADSVNATTNLSEQALSELRSAGLPWFVVTGTRALASDHFAKIDGKNIFQYYQNSNNVESVEFMWASNYKDVMPMSTMDSDFYVQYYSTLEDEYVIRTMSVKKYFTNGKQNTYKYNIVFVNPLIGGEMASVEIAGNSSKMQEVNVFKNISLKDVDGKELIIYENNSFVIRNNKWGINNVEATAKWVDDDAFDAFYNGFQGASECLLLNSDNGNVVWYNGGSINLTTNVILHAEVSFVCRSDISEYGVTAIVPIIINTKK